MSLIAPHIEAFLREHLARHRAASAHTCDSYAYSFQSLFEFAAARLRTAPSALMLVQLDAPLIAAFLEHLESARQNSAQTRNIRLAAIRSFYRFLQHREPAALEQIRRVLAIPYKKTDTRLVTHLDKTEIQALLDAPEPSTRDGIRDRAMLHLAVCAGLRVSELTGLRMSNLAAQCKSIHVLGKGRRERALPLWKPTAAALRAWLAMRGEVATPEVFVNARGEPFSRWGVAYVLRRHADAASAMCPSLRGKQISPHVLRHTCAMIVLQATQDIRKVSLWLGAQHFGYDRDLRSSRPQPEAGSHRSNRAAASAQGQVPAARPTHRAAQGEVLNGEPNGYQSPASFPCLDRCTPRIERLPIRHEL